MNFIVAQDFNETNFDNNCLEIEYSEPFSTSSELIIEEQNSNHNIGDSQDVLTNSEDRLNVYVSPSGNGTGESEDSPADFKTTLNNVANNTVVHMMDGDYNWQATAKTDIISISSKSNITIIADHPGKVTLKSTISKKLDSEFLLKNTNNVIFENIIFNPASGSKSTSNLFSISTSNNTLFKNCNFTNFEKHYTSQILELNSNTYIINCYFINNTNSKQSISLNSNSAEFLIRNCIFENNKNGNIWGYNAKYAIIVGCKFYNTTAENYNIVITNGEYNVSSCYFDEYNNGFQVDNRVGSLIFINNTVESKLGVFSKEYDVGTANLTSPTNLTVLNNTQLTVISGDVINITAVLVDDMGNYINIPKIEFEIKGVTYNATYNEGVYSFEYQVPEFDHVDVISLASKPISKYLTNLKVYNSNPLLLVKPRLNMSMDNISDCSYGDDVTINVNVSNLESGILIYEFIKDNEIIDNGTKEFADNVFTLTVNDLPVGDYTVNVKYLEDDDFGTSIVSKQFSISKANSTIDIMMDKIIPVFDNITVQAIVVPATATGNVTFTLNNDPKTVNITDSAIFNGLTEGNYTIYAVYNGDDNYNPSEANFTFSVVKLESVLEVTHSEPVVGGDVTITIKMDEAINDNVTVTINDEIQSKPLVNGTATVPLPNVIAGEIYSIKVEYAGSEKYLPKSNSTSFVISKLDTNIELTLGEKTIGEDVTLTIKLNDDINDNVTVTVDGTPESVKLTDGEKLYTISKVAAGTHSVIVDFAGNDKFNSVYNSTTFTVNKLPASINASAEDVDVGSDIVVKINITSGATGSVLVDNSYYQPVSDSIMVTIKGLSNGTYTYSVVYSGDDKYAENETTVTFTVSKIKTSISVAADNIELGDIAKITVSGLPDDAAANYTFYVDSQSPVTQQTNVYEVGGLGIGNHTVRVVYNGDDKYLTSESSKVFHVNYAMHIDNDKFPYGENSTVNVILPSDANGPLGITIDGTPFNTTNVVDGKANFTLPVLAPGNHTLSMVYQGAEYTIESEFNVTVEPKVTSLDDLKTGDDINITLPSDATGNLTVTIDGTTTVVPVVNGTASYPLGDLSAGEHEISVSYEGNYPSFSTAKKVDVAKSTPAVIPDVPSTIVAGSSINLPINLPKDANGILLVDIAGEKIYADVVNGSASISISGLKAGTTQVTYKFLGDAKYAETSGSLNLTVVKLDTTISAQDVSAVYGVSKKLTLTLTDANGNILKGKTVTVNVGSISKTLTTDKDGKVSVDVSTLTPKSYTATLKFAGDDVYTASTKNVKVTVKKATSKITAKKATFKAKKKTKKYTVTLKANNKAVSKVKVTLKVKGKTYKATTNAKGKATFKITKLTKKGKHTATIKFNGNAYYNKATKKVKIVVK